MRIASAIVALLPLISFLIFRDRRDLLGPRNLFSVLYIVGIMIPTLYFVAPSNAMSLNNSLLSEALLSDDAFFSYVALQVASYHCVLLGIEAGFGRARIKQASVRDSSDLSSGYRLWGCVFIVLGMLSFAGIMGSVGGFWYFISHLQYRTFLTRNLDVLSWILPFAQYGVLLLVASRINKKNPITLSIAVLILLTGLMCGLGGRKTLLILVVEVVVIYHYMIDEIKLEKLLTVRNITIAALLLLFFVVASDLRVEGAFDQLITDPALFVQESFSDLLRSLVGESYVPFYVEVVNYFSNHELWGGSSFLGLLTAIVPSSLFPDKPPVDDGAYLYSICQGRIDIAPPMPFNQLNGSSLPLETFGSMYANFGSPGLLIGMFLLGGCYGFVYRKMKESSCCLFWTIMYLQVILTFQLSTLRIFQLFECAVVLYLVIKLSESFVFWSDKRKSRTSGPPSCPSRSAKDTMKTKRF